MTKKRADYDPDWFYTPAEPLPVPDGLKAASQRGAFVHNWWANRWLQALMQLMDANRLARGKHYARAGQVISIDVQAGLVLAQVQGTRPRPYKQKIEVREFSRADWERVISGLASQALFSAQLLNGEMPQNIEEAFAGVDLDLFPTAEHDLVMSCSCPDWIRPCKHLAAVLLLLGESLDKDPFLLFVMRGRNRAEIMAALRDRRAALTGAGAGSPADPDAPEDEPSDLAQRFWEMGEEVTHLQLRVAAPEVEMEALRMLGEPLFSGDPALLEKLAQVYRRVSEQAIKIAYAAHDASGEAGSADDAARDNDE